MSAPVCYLCGKSIAASASSKDHAVPKQLLSGAPPKVKGFDYGGHLPTHKRCNNEFGPEAYGQRALELIEVLNNPECVFKYRHRDDPSISLMAVNAACLKNFTRRDLKFFKIIDRQNEKLAPYPPVEVLAGAKALNPKREALFTALTILAKSAAALLVSRKLHSVPTQWHVLAIPYVGEADSVDLDELFGRTKPFGKQVKVWVARLETEDFLVGYRAGAVIVFFLFRFSPTLEAWRRMRNRFAKATRLTFSGSSLNELLHGGWKQV
jgi:hypothetical protein